MSVETIERAANKAIREL